MLVVDCPYPTPPETTFTSIKSPWSTTGDKIAPYPVGLATNKSGGELYPVPELTTKTSEIEPFDTTGLTSAPVPDFKVSWGCLL